MADELYRRLSCGRCAASFAQLVVPGRPAKFCQPCRKWKPKQKTARACTNCAKTYETNRASELGCCSKACGDVVRRKLGRRREPREGAKWSFCCEFCGKSAYRCPSAGNRKKAKGPVNRFCSMACLVKARELTRKPPYCVYKAGFCSGCGCGLGSRNVVPKYCAECAYERAYTSVKDQVLKAAAEARQAIHKAVAKQFACEDCGLEYCPLYRSRLTSVCPQCIAARGRAQKRSDRNKRKALQRGVTVESVDALKVFERDRWKCYLCNGETPRAKRGTYEPDAPELDHVVPLSRGGAHAYANTRCACRACNAIKSDNLLEEIGGPAIAQGCGGPIEEPQVSDS